MTNICSPPWRASDSVTEKHFLGAFFFLGGDV